VRARLGWVAALLLIALAFTGGPDALDRGAPGSSEPAAAAGLGDDRTPQPREDDAGYRLSERGAHPRVRLPALPPSSQTVAPVPVRGTTHTLPVAEAAAPPPAGPRPHRAACTPESLQIFRC
jgi:hypothetical protein